MTNQEKYRKFCTKELKIPIFSKDWWLDTVCGEKGWDVVLFEKGGQIWASFPYRKTKKVLFDIIAMPMLTQTLGPYIKYPVGQKYYKKLSWEKEVMEALIKQLPRFDYFSQSFHWSVTNGLPFYWQGYHQSSYYTYVIENITLEELEKKFETDIRRRRRLKAKEIGIQIIEGHDVEKFYELNKMTFQRQGLQMPYSLAFVKHLFETCKEKGAVKMYFAQYQDEIIAANFLVYDDTTVYYLMGGINPEKKDLGAMDAVQFESIKFALESKRRFDFEGSMIENIEKYFRSFGAIQKPYFHIVKTNSKMLKTLRFLKELMR